MTVSAKSVVIAASAVSGRLIEHRQISAANDCNTTASALDRLTDGLRRMGRGISLADFTHLSATLNWRG